MARRGPRASAPWRVAREAALPRTRRRASPSASRDMASTAATSSSAMSSCNLKEAQGMVKGLKRRGGVKAQMQGVWVPDAGVYQVSNADDVCKLLTPAMQLHAGS
jgi:hypothetical protein